MEAFIQTAKVACMEAEDSCKEEWVAKVSTRKLMGVLEEVQALLDLLAEAGEGTLGEAAEIMKVTPVEEEGDHTILAKISRINVVSIPPDMEK